MADQVDRLFWFECSYFHVLLIEENDPALTLDASIAVIYSINYGIELVMASDCHQRSIYRHYPKI